MKNDKPTVNAEGNAVFLHDNHPKPRTRRDFLSSGLLTFSGTMFAPSIFNLFSGSLAEAAGLDCPSGGTTLPPFIQVNFAGGCNMPGMILQTDVNGQPLSSYAKHGLGTTPSSQVAFNGIYIPKYSATTTNADGSMRSLANTLPVTTQPSTNLPPGTVDFATQWVSQFYQGLLGVINPTIQLHTSIIPVPNASQDDNAMNPKDISGLVQAVGYSGKTLPGLGSRNTPTGIGQAPANVPPSAPSIIGSYADITSAISLHANVQKMLGADPGLQQSLLNLISNLSTGQAKRLVASQGSSSAQTVSQLVSCATNKNFSLSADPAAAAALDPKANASVSNIWGLGANNLAASTYAQAAMVYNNITGNCGTVSIDNGGNDYHGNPLTLTDLKDFNNGQFVGKILATAAALQKPVFIWMTADGCTGSGASPNVAPPSGDAGQQGCDYIICYDPTGRPATRSGNQSIGGFNSTGGVDKSFLTGGTPMLAALAAFYNYLSYAGQTKIYDTLIPQNTSASFTTAQKDSVSVLVGGVSS